MEHPHDDANRGSREDANRDPANLEDAGLEDYQLGKSHRGARTHRDANQAWANPERCQPGKYQP